MKKTSIVSTSPVRVLTLLFLLMLTATNSTYGSAQARVRPKLPIAIGEWEPYVGEKMTGYGFAAQMVSAALQSIGYETDYKFYPWTRSLLATDSGETWGTFPWLETPEREEQYLYSKEPLFKSRNVFFFRKNRGIVANLRYGGLKDLLPYTFGGVRGYWYEKLYAEGGNKALLSNSSEQAFLVLEAGKVDLIMEDEVVGKCLIAKLFPGREKDFGTLSTVFREDTLFLLVSRNYPDGEQLLDRFDSALRAYKTTIDYRELLKRCGSPR